MGKYLIKLKPLEPYFFGGERTFGFGKKTKQKQPYYIVSEYTPSQPTLFGTLRYIVLAQNNALIEQSDNEEEKSKKLERIEELVGENSFSFEKARNGVKQTFSFEKARSVKEKKFGKIEKISPLFLIKDEKWYIRTPFNHNPGPQNAQNSNYTPFTMKKMESLSVTSGDDTSLFPVDYKAKNGYGGGYVSLDGNFDIISEKDIFQSVVRTGIDSHRTDDNTQGINDENSFFKKERKMLINGFSFAFIAEVTDSLSTGETVVFMGQDKSPFHCTITEINENADLIKKVEKTFEGKNVCNVFYALSDIMPVDENFPGKAKFDYYIADTKVLRNLESNMSESSYYARLKKSEKLYKLITSGSVFFTNDDVLKCEALEVIGMNILVKI